VVAGDPPFDDLARSIARNTRIIGMDYDDILQEARIAAWRSTRTYDPSRGMSRYGYAKLAIKAALITAMKAQTRGKRLIHHSATSLDAPLAIDDTDATLHDVVPGPALEPSDLLAATHDARALISGVGLTPLEHRAALGIAIGMTYDELGADEKQIDNASQRAKRKYEAGEMSDEWLAFDAELCRVMRHEGGLTIDELITEFGVPRRIVAAALSELYIPIVDAA
jgi:RNA polymerase sporulation-specific sigma factor